MVKKPDSQPDLGLENDAENVLRSGFLRFLPTSKLQLGAGLTSLLLILSGTGWLLTQEKRDPPHVRFKKALDLIDQRDDVNARRRAASIARGLSRIEYNAPEFPGGLEYILGVSEFREAEEMDENDSQREARYEIAAEYLVQAESRALVTEREPEWAYALGVSQYRIGSSAKARKKLERAFKEFEPGRIEAAMVLTNIYLEIKSPKLLDMAFEYNAKVLNSPEISVTQRDRAYLQRAQLYLAQNQHDEAKNVLENLSDASTDDQGIIVFRAQTLMAEREFAQAMQLLQPVANDIGLEQIYTRQASYLIGVCAEELGKRDEAISYLLQTAQKYESKQEGTAANLRAGDLLRRAGRKEEALEAYRRALSSVESSEEYRNRWLGIQTFRNAVQTAWNEWLEQGSHREAIALSRMMPPLFPTVQAKELESDSIQHWAIYLQNEYDDAPFSEWTTRRKELVARWRESGKAYAELAELLRTTSRYSNALWISAEDYIKGHDFDNALTQLDKFIRMGPPRRLPLAHVRRGEVLMDLNRLDEALQSFEHTLVNYPTDQAAVRAEFLMGECHLEMNHPDKAAKVWREILTSSTLTPDAQEWRLALFSLGRLMFYRASMLQSRAFGPRNGDNAEKQSQLLTDAYVAWEESIMRLEEFLERYAEREQSHNKSIEARFLLAKGLQQSAEYPRFKLASAETENARLEMRQKMQLLLRSSIVEFRTLQSQLRAIDETRRLDRLGQRMLRDCHFEIAHTYYSLDDYENAIIAYSSAANRYAQDPQVLTSYVQMANCFDHLDKPTEARSMLEKAKIILRQMPDEIFRPELTSMSRTEWEQWLDQSRFLHQATL